MGDSTSNVVFKTPSHGMMQRSHPKSKFLRFHKGSPMAKDIFDPNGKQAFIGEKYSNIKPYQEVEVLQIMVFGSDEFLVEIVALDNLNQEQNG